MKTLKNREAGKINQTSIGAPKPSGPASTQTDRAAAFTPQTRTVHRTTRRARKNTQRNTRQTNNNRKQTQNNRGTTQNQKMTELKVSGNYCTWSILARTLRPLRNRSGSTP